MEVLPGYNLQPKYIVDMGEKRSFYGRRIKFLSFFFSENHKLLLSIRIVLSSRFLQISTTYDGRGIVYTQTNN